MSDSATPGWYHAEGDPPNTERYWDGSAWTEGPRPIGGTPPPAAPTDMPSMDPPGSNMPVMGQTPPPSDLPGEAPGGFGTVTPGPSDTPGGFGSVTPSPTTPPPGMPVTGGAPGFGTPPAGGAMPGGMAPGGFPGAPVGMGAAYAESSQAVMALILSLVGLICCLTSPVGAYLGYAEKNAIDAGRRDPKNRGMAQAAFIIGLVLTGLSALFILLVLVGGFSA